MSILSRHRRPQVLLNYSLLDDIRLRTYLSGSMHKYDSIRSTSLYTSTTASSATGGRTSGTTTRMECWTTRTVSI